MASGFTLFAFLVVCHALPAFLDLQQTSSAPPVTPTVPINDSFGSSFFVAMLSTLVVEARDKTFVLTGLLAATKMRRAVAFGALCAMFFLTIVDELIGYVFVPLIKEGWVNWAAVIAYIAFFWLYVKDAWYFKPQDIPESLREPLLPPKQPEAQGSYPPTQSVTPGQPVTSGQPTAPGVQFEYPMDPPVPSAPPLPQSTPPAQTSAPAQTEYEPILSGEERRRRWLDLSAKTAALIFLGEWSDATMVATSDLAQKNDFWGVLLGCMVAYCITTTCAVFAGRWLGSKMSYRKLLMLTALIFLLFAVFTIIY